MREPDHQQSLTIVELEQWAKYAGYDIMPTYTPGLMRMSRIERLITAALLLVISGVIYIHCDVAPFLPLRLSPTATYNLTGISFVTMGISGIAVIWLGLGYAFRFLQSVWYRVFPRQPRLICPNCGKWSLVKRYLDGEYCPKCGSDRVYCGRCGRSVPFGAFTSETGCPPCSSHGISVRW